MLAAAYGYVDRSNPWRIFPADAKRKCPIIETGIDHAEHSTIDLDTITDWSRRGMLNAIGMPTGISTGTVVIDIDRKHDGEAAFAELEDALGPLPRTKVVQTQSGGMHIYTAHPGEGIRVKSGAGVRSALGRLLGGRAGVDVRADGGIVVLPPSCGYRWISDDDEPLPPLPKLWLAAIQGAGDEPPQVNRTSESVRFTDRRWSDPERGDPVYEGDRNGYLYRRGVAVRLAGASDAELIDYLERCNAALVNPPLSSKDVAKIAASASRANGAR